MIDTVVYAACYKRIVSSTWAGVVRVQAFKACLFGGTTHVAQYRHGYLILSGQQIHNLTSSLLLILLSYVRTMVAHLLSLSLTRRLGAALLR